MRFRSPVSLFIILGLILSGALIPILFAVPGGATAQDAPTIPPTNTPRVVPTAIPTNTPRPSPSPLPSPTLTPSPTLPPTEAPRQPTPTLYYPPDFTSDREQPTAIPTAMPRFRSQDGSGNTYDILNVLLLGHDGEVIPGDPNFKTDTMIIVSINRDTSTVSMISLPRDLFVYIPNWGMGRLNVAWGYGESIGWTDGGWGMLRQTILYNFGIETHYYAMVDFSGFTHIIDQLGGVTIAVDCPILDDICTANCDDGIEDNETWEKKVLDVGVYTMLGEEALWYARSRENTNDFDRGRRQQQILRAIWATAKEKGLITQLPDLYDSLTQVVQTNMPLSEIVPLMPLALSIEPNAIENHFFKRYVETVPWTPTTGSYAGANVQVPDPNGGMQRLIENFLSPPTQNRLVLENARIEIFNGSPNANWDIVAVDRLVWEGFAPWAMGPAEQTDVIDTLIIDFTGTTKGSSLNELLALLNINPNNVQLQPDANRTTDFRIILGANYNSCVGREWVDPATMTE